MPSRLANKLGKPALIRRIAHRTDTRPPLGIDRVLVRANQEIFERGWSPPWVWSAADCNGYWVTRTTAGPSNNPSDYASKPTGIIDVMADFWSPNVTNSASVLEIGSNSGPNLERLRQLGYSRLSGIEINDLAIEEMRSAFPDLASSANIHRGPAEDVLPTLPASSFDVVFSMAVLHHIHPATKSIFAEMTRVARNYVCVIEPETITVPYIFARQYSRVFERLGCSTIRTLTITPDTMADVDSYKGYIARLFSVPAGETG
jgi:SAM-dependent methyltransferase